MQYGSINNIDQLKKTTVNDISSSYSNSTNTVTRQVVKSQSAYVGGFKQFNAFTPSFEFILSPIKSFALVTFGKYNMISDVDQTRYSIKNYGSIATGFYFYSSGKASSINIGAYYEWTSNNVTGDRTERVGLKTSIPITPL